MENKKCCRCKEIKPIGEFYRDKGKKDGRYSQCKKCVDKSYKAWCNKNPEKRKEHYKRYLENNPDKRKESCNKYLIAHPEKRKETCRKWWKNNPEKAKAITTKRRALLKGAITEKIDLAEVYESYNWVCGICGKKINKNLKFPNQNRISLDHIIPISKGGNHLYSNVQPAHLSCNVSKNNKIDNIQMKLA